MRDIGLLAPQAHGTDKSFVLDWSSREIWSDEFGNHPLPTLLGGLFASLHHLEYFMLRNSSNLGEYSLILGDLLERPSCEFFLRSLTVVRAASSTYPYNHFEAS
jgi:hypothetical protein